MLISLAIRKSFCIAVCICVDISSYVRSFVNFDINSLLSESVSASHRKCSDDEETVKFNLQFSFYHALVMEFKEA